MNTRIVRMITILVVCVIGSHLPTSNALSSTVANTTTDCKYVDANGTTVFEKKCLVYYSSLMAIKGVRKCDWTFFDIHFTSSATAAIAVSGQPKVCSSTVNDKKAKVEEQGYGDYNLIFITEEGELFYLKFSEDM